MDNRLIRASGLFPKIPYYDSLKGFMLCADLILPSIIRDKIVEYLMDYKFLTIEQMYIHCKTTLIQIEWTTVKESTVWHTNVFRQYSASSNALISIFDSQPNIWSIPPRDPVYLIHVNGKLHSICLQPIMNILEYRIYPVEYRLPINLTETQEWKDGVEYKKRIQTMIEHDYIIEQIPDAPGQPKKKKKYT